MKRREIVTAVLFFLALFFISCGSSKNAGNLTPQEVAEGWESLISSDLSEWIYEPGTWAVKNGVLTPNGGGDIWTKADYGDFILSIDFKISPKGNSGVFLRTGSIENWLHTAIEVQVLDSYGNPEPGKHDCGAIYDCLAPSANAVNKAGEWNNFTITCIENKIQVVLNDEQVIDMDLNRWTEAHRNPDGTKNKFNNPYKDMPRSGRIGLQFHGDPVWYKNIKVKTL